MSDKDRPFELAWAQAINPNLRGWSPGDEERPVPVPPGDALEEAAKSWNQPADAASRQVPPELEFTEFPLYYGKTGARHIARTRRYYQVGRAGSMISDHGVPLVLMTNDFKVFAAKSIWKLLWVYLKVKIFGMKKPKGPKKKRLPSYR